LPSVSSVPSVSTSSSLPNHQQHFISPTSTASPPFASALPSAPLVVQSSQVHPPSLSPRSSARESPPPAHDEQTLTDLLPRKNSTEEIASSVIWPVNRSIALTSSVSNWLVEQTREAPTRS